MPGAAPTEIVHATCVALNGRALLIRGASGRGKSALALELMGMGAELVADDRVVLTRKGDQVIADAPAPIRGMIEARGIGLLNATPAGPAPVMMVADLDQAETERLPRALTTQLLGREVTLLRAVQAPHFAAALLQYLKAGRQAET